ncbi:MAG: LysE family transporter [Lachnospiraceae bacterium]|nr:LysE family transporter [Lachnospiraceae bacterium]
MTIDMFVTLLVFAATTTFSPGPNNILMLSLAGQYGFKKCLKIMTGIWTGSFTLMLCCGLFSSALGKLLPGVAPYFKYVGAVYILWLAWKTGTRKPVTAGAEEQKEPAFLTGFFLQMANVKIMLYGLTAFTTYITPYVQGALMLVFFAFILMTVAAIGNIIWAAVGNVCQRFYTKYYRIFNVVMALLLVWCAVKILVTI